MTGAPNAVKGELMLPCHASTTERLPPGVTVWSCRCEAKRPARDGVLSVGVRVKRWGRHRYSRLQLTKFRSGPDWLTPEDVLAVPLHEGRIGKLEALQGKTQRPSAGSYELLEGLTRSLELPGDKQFELMVC